MSAEARRRPMVALCPPILINLCFMVNLNLSKQKLKQVLLCCECKCTYFWRF